MCNCCYDDLERFKNKNNRLRTILRYTEYRGISTVLTSKYRSYGIFFRGCNETQSRRQAASAGNDGEAEEEEEAVVDKRTSNVAAGQSEL